jgi:hypothetical protein
MKKKHARHIRDIAEKVGEIKTETFEWVNWDGSDLLLTGLKKLPDGSPILKDGIYAIKNPVIITHSTKKQLKRSFRKEGDKGIYNTVKREYERRFPGEIP